MFPFITQWIYPWKIIIYFATQSVFVIIPIPSPFRAVGAVDSCSSDTKQALDKDCPF